MIFYSTKLTDSERSSHIQEFFRESFPMFSSCEAPKIPAFLLFKYFHSLVFSGKFPRLHSLKLCKEIATRRIFGGILTKILDIIKDRMVWLPICMIFYSTKLTDSKIIPHIQEFFWESFLHLFISSCRAPKIPAFCYSNLLMPSCSYT